MTGYQIGGRRHALKSSYRQEAFQVEPKIVRIRNATRREQPPQERVQIPELSQPVCVDIPAANRPTDIQIPHEIT
jgi:hypothetical protein